ncbi:MAG: hypothetical protein Q8906_00145 [Bacillota bacterium]|nr:hypothetical protein [Bacillota bacterium]MDP4168981.1 hypothetical protein [Bacillota bacterium]
MNKSMDNTSILFLDMERLNKNKETYDIAVMRVKVEVKIVTNRMERRG